MNKSSNLAKAGFLRQKARDSISLTLKKRIRGRVVEIKLGSFKFPFPDKKRKHYEFKPTEKEERSVKFLFRIPIGGRRK